MPDADAAWRCPHGCDPRAFTSTLCAAEKDIVDDMLHKYGFDFKEAPRPMIIDPAPIVITAPMMIDPAFPLCVAATQASSGSSTFAGERRSRMSGSP